MRRVFAAIAVLATCAQAPAASLLPAAEQTDNTAQVLSATDQVTLDQSETKPQPTQQSQQEAQQPTEQPVKDAQQTQQQTYSNQASAYYWHPQYGWVSNNPYNPQGGANGYSQQPASFSNSITQQSYLSNYYQQQGYQQHYQPAQMSSQSIGGCRT